MQDRVYYYSKIDLSVGHYLKMAEKRIQEVTNGDVPTDLEGIIELWHIKRMMDDECRYLDWTDEKFNTLKQSTSGYSSIIARFFSGLDPKSLKSEFEQLDWTYKKTFWKIIDAYKLYKLIEPDTLREILTKNNNYLREVLDCQGIVEKFKRVIREILLCNVNSAHILLDKYVAKRDLHQDVEIHLPSNLTIEDKEQILINYLQGDNPNVNYVRLITQIKDDKSHIIISTKTRLKAERLYNKLKKEMLNDPHTTTIHWSFGVQFIDEEGRLPIELSLDESGNPTYIYSIPYIRNQKNLNRVGNCIFLFGWVNQHFLMNLINKRTEVDTIESLFMDIGRDSYPTHLEFNKKNDLALYQVFAYNKVLTQQLNSSFETELKVFYEDHLRTQYGYCGLPINLPANEDPTLNKCRVICPELDSIVKQYNTFVEVDEIDEDYIRLSKPLKVEEGKSLLTNKYYQIAEENKDIWNVLWELFGSGNSLLAHVKPFKDKKYHSLIELLEHEKNVLYANYHAFQKPHLDFLIQQQLIGVDNDGSLYIVSQVKIEVLRSLWEYDVCSYWHYDNEGRQVLDEMLEKGWLMQDDHLLSKPERDYFSFYLDNAKYTNGMAYRNHYMHGSTPPVNDENAHLIAYHTLLRLFAILILKIEDDLWSADRVLAIHTTKII